MHLGEVLAQLIDTSEAIALTTTRAVVDVTEVSGRQVDFHVALEVCLACVEVRAHTYAALQDGGSLVARRDGGDLSADDCGCCSRRPLGLRHNRGERNAHYVVRVWLRG